jgi:acetyltransferase-like isoleucine patch superfamily enzyme
MIHPSVVIEPFSLVRAKFVGEYVKISTCVRIEQECVIQRRTFIGHGVVMRPYTYIAQDCVIGHHVVFEGRCAVGNGTLIQAQSNITRGVSIGEKVFIGMMFCGGNDNEIIHKREKYYGEFVPQPYVIEDYARIGFRVDVLPGVVIGKNSFVAAGSLVTKDVPENARVKGRPAVVYGEVPEDERL